MFSFQTIRVYTVVQETILKNSKKREDMYNLEQLYSYKLILEQTLEKTQIDGGQHELIFVNHFPHIRSLSAYHVLIQVFTDRLKTKCVNDNLVMP